MMMDVSEIVAGYCGEDDSACKNLAYEATLKQFHAGITTLDEIEYPDDFHAGLKQSIDSMHETIKQIDVDNLEEVVGTLLEITDEINEMEDVNEAQRAVVQASMSIAVESTKLWHNVHYVAEDHPLRHLKSSGNRKLQTPLTEETNANLLGIFVIPYNIISADVASGLANGVNLLNAVGGGGAAGLVYWLPVLLISIGYFAIPASLRAAVSPLN